MSDERAVTRRDALKLGAATATAVGGILALGGPGLALENQPGQNGAEAQAGAVRGFTVEIDGCPDASRNVLDVAVDDLQVDALDVTQSKDLDFRTYIPGQTHVGEATISAGFTEAGSTQLRKWVDAWASGQRDLRKISVTFNNTKGDPGRSYDLMDCFPTQWSAVNFDTSSSVQTETIRVKVGRIEFKT